MLTAIQWTLGIAGLLLLAFGMLWDRPGWRGRAALRCRKCWFDLTGTPGSADVSKTTPILCGECGKQHTSVRSMRRTRRWKRLITASFVLWLIVYSIPVVPAVQNRGWIAAVPGVALVATVPFFSEQKNSSDLYISFVVTALQQNGQTAYAGLDTKIFREMQARLWRRDQSSGLGWPSRRLLFLVGRFESKKDLTDLLTMKGMAYRRLIASWVRADRAYPFEVNWARSQVHFEIEPDRPIYESGRVYGRLRLRSLSGEQGEISVGMGRLKLSPTMAASGSSMHSGPIRQPSSYREPAKWDRLILVEENDRRIVNQKRPRTWSTPIPIGHLGTGQSVSIWPTDLDAHLSLRFEDHRIPLKKTILITKSQTIPLPPIVSTGDELRRTISDRIEPILYAEYDSQSNRYRPAFRFDRNNMGYGPRLTDNVLFGGRIELLARLSSGQSDGEQVIATVNLFGDNIWILENDAVFEASREWGRTIKSGFNARDTAFRIRPRLWGSRQQRKDLVRVYVRVQNSWARSPQRRGIYKGFTEICFGVESLRWS